MYITPFTTSRMMTRRLPPPRLPGGMSGSTSVHSRRSDRLDNAARRDCSGGDFRSSTCGTSKTNRCHTRNHKRFPPFKSSLRLTDSRDSQTSRTDTKRKRRAHWRQGDRTRATARRKRKRRAHLPARSNVLVENEGSHESLPGRSWAVRLCSWAYFPITRRL